MLTSEMVGRRVVVRRALGANGGPPFRDALGDLIALDDEVGVIDTRSGVVRVSLPEVTLARVVEPSTADQLALESVAAQGWQARTVRLSTDGWLLRADSGWTGRANSALVLRTPRRPLVEVLAEIDAFYAEHDLPSCVAVPLPAGAAVDAALERLGWRVQNATDVLITRLDLFLAATGAATSGAGTTGAGTADQASTAVHRATAVDTSTAVDMSPEPSPEWLRVSRYRSGLLPAGAAALLVRHERAMFASIYDGGDLPVAVARGVVDAGWLGVTVLVVDEAHRRRGLGTALLQALAEHACAVGATRAYLQVAVDNDPAHRLYRSLGWYRHHSYVYRAR